MPWASGSPAASSTPDPVGDVTESTRVMPNCAFSSSAYSAPAAFSRASTTVTPSAPLGTVTTRSLPQSSGLPAASRPMTLPASVTVSGASLEAVNANVTASPDSSTVLPSVVTAPLTNAFQHGTAGS